MRYHFIDTRRALLDLPLRRLCQLLCVSVSGYYAWRNRGASNRQLNDMVLLAHIRAAYARNRKVYGSLRVWHELLDEGIEVDRDRVARLMRDNV